MFAPGVCLQEIHRLQDSADQANKHASFFERESQRLEVRVKDLSQQVEETLLWLNVLFAIGVFTCCCISGVCLEVVFGCIHGHFGCPKYLGNIKASPQDSMVFLLSKLEYI